MSLAKPAPPVEPATGYERDLYLWSVEQADLLRRGRFGDVDVANVVEEIETLGRSERNGLISAFKVLVHHLLKWQFQPALRGPSWRTTIANQRDAIAFAEADSPSLAAQAGQLIGRAYPRARRAAALETGLALAGFPETCPYTVEQLRDDDWLPR